MDILTNEKLLELEVFLITNNPQDLCSEYSINNLVDRISPDDDSIYQDESSIPVGETERDLLKSKLEQEIQCLVKVFGKSPPFQYSTGTRSLTVQKSAYANNKGYLFCLYLAKHGAGNTSPYSSDELGRHFEFIVMSALKESLSGYAVCRLEKIHKDLESLCNKIGVYFRGLSQCNPDAQDAGVDIIAYKKTRAEATRGHILLVQCAAGKNYPKKEKDIDISVWQQFIGDLYTHTKMLAIADAFLDEKHFLSGSTLSTAGEVFDRFCIWTYTGNQCIKNTSPETDQFLSEFFPDDNWQCVL